MGLTEEQIADSQEILEEHGFIERHLTLGPHRIYAFTITLSGFQEFATIAVPNFDDLISRVAAVLVRREYMTSGKRLVNGLAITIRTLASLHDIRPGQPRRGPSSCVGATPRSC